MSKTIPRSDSACRFQTRLYQKASAHYLDGFDPVHFGLMWQSKPTALTSAFVDAFKRRAQAFAQSRLVGQQEA